MLWVAKYWLDRSEETLGIKLVGERRMLDRLDSPKGTCQSVSCLHFSDCRLRGPVRVDDEGEYQPHGTRGSVSRVRIRNGVLKRFDVAGNKAQFRATSTDPRVRPEFS
jgi:hypothetical protein